MMSLSVILNQLMVCVFSSHGNDGRDCNGSCCDSVLECYGLADHGRRRCAKQSCGSGRRTGLFSLAFTFHWPVL